ncbi:hypothetical protein [Sorangium sp. So ce1153]|uniref:hypothetical protein n=1 Tax=Sorangium sp. So ce1153 TaxID=3133333 RepID=UPI003F633621
MYGDLVLNPLNEAARRALEAIMKGYEYQSDFAKKYVAQGRELGRRKGERAILLRQLRARFGELPEAAVARVDGADRLHILRKRALAAARGDAFLWRAAGWPAPRRRLRRGQMSRGSGALRRRFSPGRLGARHYEHVTGIVSLYLP